MAPLKLPVPHSLARWEADKRTLPQSDFTSLHPQSVISPPETSTFPERDRWTDRGQTPGRALECNPRTLIPEPYGNQAFTCACVHLCSLGSASGKRIRTSSQEKINNNAESIYGHFILRLFCPGNYRGSTVITDEISTANNMAYWMLLDWRINNQENQASSWLL